jgi:hypothetical protein
MRATLKGHAMGNFVGRWTGKSVPVGDGIPTCERIYRFLKLHKSEHDGNSPTFREIMQGCGIPSTSMVLFYLNKLERQGLIRRPEPKVGNRFAGRIEIVGGHWDYTEV